MQVIVGVDPHKASHTAVAIGAGEDELASKPIRPTGEGRCVVQVSRRRRPRRRRRTTRRRACG